MFKLSYKNLDILREPKQDTSQKLETLFSIEEEQTKDFFEVKKDSLNKNFYSTKTNFNTNIKKDDKLKKDNYLSHFITKFSFNNS